MQVLRRGSEGEEVRRWQYFLTWSTAFDINYAWNRLGALPALRGEKGSVRELVAIAHQHGFYWGGHFSRRDGMHFEVARVL